MRAVASSPRPWLYVSDRTSAYRGLTRAAISGDDGIALRLIRSGDSDGEFKGRTTFSHVLQTIVFFSYFLIFFSFFSLSSSLFFLLLYSLFCAFVNGYLLASAV